MDAPIPPEFKYSWRGKGREGKAARAGAGGAASPQPLQPVTPRCPVPVPVWLGGGSPGTPPLPGFQVGASSPPCGLRGWGWMRPRGRQPSRGGAAARPEQHAAMLQLLFGEGGVGGGNLAGCDFPWAPSARVDGAIPEPHGTLLPLAIRGCSSGVGTNGPDTP